MATGKITVICLIIRVVITTFLFPENPFCSHLKSLQVGGQEFKYYDVRSLGGEKFGECTFYHKYCSVWGCQILEMTVLFILAWATGLTFDLCTPWTVQVGWLAITLMPVCCLIVSSPDIVFDVVHADRACSINEHSGWEGVVHAMLTCSPIAFFLYCGWQIV